MSHHCHHLLGLHLHVHTVGEGGGEDEERSSKTDGIANFVRKGSSAVSHVKLPLTT